jgi:hypothetical protein
MPVDKYIKEGREKIANEDMMGLMGLMGILYGSTLKKGLGDKFYSRELATEKLDLETEDLGEAVESVVRELEAK